MKLVLAIVLVMFVAACATTRRLRPETEYVLTPGMKVSAGTPNGPVEIVAGRGTDRTFTGAGWSKRRSLIPRATRWYGSLGLYDPASSDSPYGRLLVDEGRLFFDSESEALRYLYVGSAKSKPVFNGRGLVVGYHAQPTAGGEPTRTVFLWQIYIKGRRPLALRGADDAAITVEGGEILDVASPHPAPIGYAHVTGDREYVPPATRQ